MTTQQPPVTHTEAISTRTLLGCGLLAGPAYLVVSLAQALTREGFDLARHSWSLLSNGTLGWIQISNFVLAGVLTIALAVGIRRTLGRGPGGTWGPRLLAGYGASLIGAAVFRADPAMGFPVGTPDTATPVSWHGTLHLVCAGIGFTGLVAACFVLARRFAADRRTGWAWYSRVTGILFLAGFVGIASGAGNPSTVIGFVVAVVLGWAWIAAIAADLYKHHSGQ